MVSNRERLRRFRITLRVTADERRSLAATATRAGLCLSAFVRWALFRTKPPRAARRPVVEITMLAAVLAQLGTIATDLHQIAEAVRRAGATSLPMVERELLHALASLRRARIALFHALGRKAPS